MVESEGIAPSSTCLQGRCITCLPRPHGNWMGRPPRCCPEQTECWRLCCARWRTACGKLARLPGMRLPSPASRMPCIGLFAIANLQCTRLGGRPQGPPWREAILLSNHNRGNYEGRKHRCSRPMPFQQRTNTSCQLALPTRGFTAAVSVFRGTPPPKPLKCKSVSNRFGTGLRSRWAEPTGEEFVLLCAILTSAPADISETSPGYRSQTVHLSLRSLTISSRETKNPAYPR